MMFKKLMSAAVAGVLSVTSLALPTAYDELSAVVTAADEEEAEKDVYDLEGLVGVKPTELPYTLVADGVEDGQRQKNFILTEEQRNSTKLIVNVTTDCTDNWTFAMYGFGTRIKADKYWKKHEVEKKSQGAKSFTLEIPIPSSLQGYVNMIGLGIWWPNDNSNFEITSIECEGESETKYPMPTTGGGPSGERFTPVSANDQSGSCDFKENEDNTATFTSTLTVNAKVSPKPELSTDDKTRYEISLADLPIEDMKDVQLQSFEYVLKSKNVSMDKLEYAGDISVTADSDADTEAVFGKTTHRYMDRTAEEVEEKKDDLKITDIHAPYVATSCYDYAKIAWDIPKSVQPFVDKEGTVGFNLLKAYDNEKGDIPVSLESCRVTYTRKVTLPFTEKIKKTGTYNIKSSDDENYKDLKLDSLELSRHDVLDAVKVSFESSDKLQTFVGNLGISLDKDKSEDEKEYYSTGITCINLPEKTFDVMWVLPENIRDRVWGGEGNKLEISYYYGDDQEGTENNKITITGVEYYISRFPERDLIVKDSEGNVIEKKLSVTADRDTPLNMSIEGCTYSSEDATIAFIDDGGILHALKAGTAEVTINTPKGQDVKIKVTVKDKTAVTTAATTTSTTTTTTTTTASAKVSTDESTESKPEVSKSVTESSKTPVTLESSTKATTASSTVSESKSTSKSSSTSKTVTSTTKATTSATTTKKTTTSPQEEVPGKTTTTTPAVIDIDLSTIIYGDVDLNGDVDLADITMLAKYMLSNVSYPLGEANDPASEQRAKISADINGDKSINSIDLSRLIEFNLGKLEKSDLIPESARHRF